MADARWKRSERQVAALIGGQRQPNNGHPQADVLSDAFAVEVKTRKRLPDWIHEAVKQAENAAAATGKNPLVVLVESRQGVRARRYALLALDAIAGAGSLTDVLYAAKSDGQIE